jgi:hypothetical protein
LISTFLAVGSAVGSALAEHLEIMKYQKNSAKAEATDSKLLLVTNYLTITHFKVDFIQNKKVCMRPIYRIHRGKF